MKSTPQSYVRAYLEVPPHRDALRVDEYTADGRPRALGDRRHRVRCILPGSSAALREEKCSVESVAGLRVQEGADFGQQVNELRDKMK